MNQTVASSPQLRAAFRVDILPISMNDELADLRTFRLAKIGRSVLLYCTTLRRLLNSKRPNIAYLTLSPNGFAFLRDAGLVVLLRLFRIQHVFHLHSRGLKATRSRGLCWKAISGFVFARARVITLSKGLYSDISDVVPMERVTVVPNGIEDLVGDEAFKSLWFSRLERPVPTILFLSNMLESKGPLLLLEALAALVRRGLAVSFVLLLLLLRTANVNRLQRWLATIYPIFPFLAYCYVSVFWSGEPALTLIRSVETTALVVFSLCWVLLAARHTVKTDEVARIVFIGMMAVVLYGFVLNVFISGTPFRFIVQSEDSQRERLVFGYLHPLSSGDLLAMTTIALCASCVRLHHKMIFGAALISMLFLTDSTGATMLTLVFAPVLVLLHALQQPRWGTRILIAALVGLLAATLVAAMQPSFIEKFMNDERMWSLTGRVQIWESIFNAGLAETWFGTGYDASRPVIGEAFGRAYHAHNFYLSIAVELGYVGVFLFMLFLLPWLWHTVRNPTRLGLGFAGYALLINMTGGNALGKAHIVFMLFLPYCWAVISPWFSGIKTCIGRGGLTASSMEQQL